MRHLPAPLHSVRACGCSKPVTEPGCMPSQSSLSADILTPSQLAKSGLYSVLRSITLMLSHSTCEGRELPDLHSREGLITILVFHGQGSGLTRSRYFFGTLAPLSQNAKATTKAMNADQLHQKAPERCQPPFSAPLLGHPKYTAACTYLRTKY